ncbi:dihydroneopterin aldolase, partial [Escherichia coli]|nr:dihydroneopterin aldolase [Escherichia coli]
MDTITLTGVHANGTHGVLTFEHERPQTFVVDVTLHLDLAAAGQSDDLNDTIDYGRVAKDIVAVIEGPHVDLIERLAQRIADKI